MPIQLVVFLGIQFFAIIICSIVALIFVYLRRQALRREMDKIAAGSSVQEAYQRFVAARLYTIQMAQSTTMSILYPILSLSRVQPNFETIFFRTTGDPQASFLGFLSIFAAILIGSYIGTFVLDVAGTILVDREAYKVFQLGSLSQEAMIRKKVHIFLLKLVSHIDYVGVVALISLFLPNIYFLRLLLVVSFAIYPVLVQIFANIFYVLSPAVRPLEQTEWAYLGERIAQWAHLGGVTFSSIRIEQDLIGKADVRVAGPNLHTLVISERLLRNSDWRQQDAMITFGVGCIRTQPVVLLTQSFLLALMGLLTSSIVFMQLFMDSPVHFMFMLLILLLFIIFLISTIPILYRFYYRIERNAAFLTGDPLAVMVMLNTINILNGINTTTRRNGILLQNRLKRLDALARQLWPRAPYADNRVPAIAPVYFDQHLLTVPLDQAALTSQPAPVPTSWYATV